MEKLPTDVSRRDLTLSAFPLIGALLSSCMTTSSEPTTTVRDPALAPEVGARLLRHVNTVLITPATPGNYTRSVEIFWSHSCGDTMRRYPTVILPFLQNIPNGTVVALHLIARSPLDLPACVAIRAVNQEHYARAIQAILKVGAAKGTYLTEDEVKSAIAPFPRGDMGFLPGFAENCMRQSQRMALDAGISETPAVIIDGRSAKISALKN